MRTHFSTELNEQNNKTERKQTGKNDIYTRISLRSESAQVTLLVSLADSAARTRLPCDNEKTAKTS